VTQELIPPKGEPSGRERAGGKGPRREHRGGTRSGGTPLGSKGSAYSGTREEMSRAIRRLDLLEWLILLMAVGFALVGGAGVAWILSVGTGLGFRSTWAVLSILLLGVPGVVVWMRERRN
jgi:hypothetical protein